MQINQDPNDIDKRLNMLFIALWHCSEFQSVGRGYIFTPGERIQINQERGSLYSQLSNDPEADVRHLQVSEDINDRIKHIYYNLYHE